MNKGILLILAMSVIVFGSIMWMASAGSAAPSGTVNIALNSANARAPAGGAPATPAAPVPASVQVVSVRATGSGYDHPQLSVKAGQPVEFHFSAVNAGCGAQLILDGFNVNLISRNGEDQVARFTPTQPGTYAFHCGMNMFRGTLQVV